MALHIVKATEPIVVEHPVFLLIGDPGLGKTTMAGTADRPLLLDFDLGAHRAAVRPDAIPVRTWADVAELTESKDALAEYQTIIPDTVGRCIDVMALDIISRNPKLGRGGVLTQQGWGELKARFRAWLGALRALGKDVVLLSHAKEEKDGDTRIIRADVSGGSYAEIIRSADFIGYLTMSGRDRVLDFSSSEKSVGKNPAGWQPIPIPHYAKDGHFLANLMQQGKEALGKISAANAQALSLVADWTAKLEECDGADSINALGPALAKITPPVVKAQVSHLVSARAAALGLVADTKAKKYVAAKPQPEEATA